MQQEYRNNDESTLWLCYMKRQVHFLFCNEAGVTNEKKRQQYTSRFANPVPGLSGKQVYVQRDG